MKGWKTVIVLATLVLAAAAYIGLVEPRLSSTDEIISRREHLFREFHRDRVGRVEVRHASGRYELRKRGSEWVVVSDGPPRAADQAEAERMVYEVESAQPVRRVGALDAATRTRFGLDHPRAVVTAYEGDRPAVRFAVGGAVSDEEAVYVESEAIGYVMPRAFADAFDRGASALRDRTLLEVAVARIERLELSGAGGRRVLARRGPVWRLDEPAQPVGGRASRGAVEAITAELDDLEATRVLADGVTTDAALARYGLAEPTVRLVIHRATGAPIALRVGGACAGHDGEFTATREGSGTVGCLGRAFVDALKRDAQAFTDNHPVAARADEVSRVRLHAPSGDLVLRREDDTWSAEGSTHPVDSEAVESWLTTLHDLAAGDRLDEGALAAHGLARPATTIEITRTGVEGVERVNVGAADATGVYVSRDDERLALRFPPSAAEALVVEPIRFRPRRLVRDAQDDLQALLLEAGATREEIVRADGRLRLARPVSASVDIALVQDLAHQLANLDADRWVAARARPEHGLAQPRGRVVARFEGAGPREADAGTDAGHPRVRSYTLAFGAEAPGGGIYATLEGTAGVFVVSRSLWDAAAAPHLDRGAVRLDTTGVDRVVLTRDGARVVLRREGERWRTETGTPADAARVRELLDRAGELIAARVVGYGAAPADARLGAITLEVTAAGDAGARTERLTIGADTGGGEAGGHYARREGLDATFVVPGAAVTALRAFTP